MQPSASVSKLFTQAIEWYQCDVVGWLMYCTSTDKHLLQEKRSTIQQPALEILRIKERIRAQVHAPNVKKIYSSKESFLDWLHQEYNRDQAFYEAIIENTQKSKSDSKVHTVNHEIDIDAREYLRVLRQKYCDEARIIDTISDKTWNDIKNSQYPKVMLGLILGASEEVLVQNFGLYFLSRLKAQFAGSRTALLSSSGPNYWHELDRCEVELTYFKNTVVRPCIQQMKKK